jgi:hypothetical protein
MIRFGETVATLLSQPDDLAQADAARRPVNRPFAAIIAQATPA